MFLFFQEEKTLISKLISKINVRFFKSVMMKYNEQ